MFSDVSTRTDFQWSVTELHRCDWQFCGRPSWDVRSDPPGLGDIIRESDFVMVAIDPCGIGLRTRRRSIACLPAQLGW
jgi:hypothetical protein